MKSLLRDFLVFLFFAAFVASFVYINSLRTTENEKLAKARNEKANLASLMARVLPLVNPLSVPDNLSISQLKQIIVTNLPSDDRITTDDDTFANFERDPWGNERRVSILNIDGQRYIRIWTAPSSDFITVIIGSESQDISIYGYTDK